MNRDDIASRDVYILNQGLYSDTSRVRMAKIVFTGGRDYVNEDKVAKIMRKLSEKYGVFGGRFIAIAGAAPGLDTLVLNWCLKNKMPFAAMFPAWDHFDRPAGNLRNSWMIDYFLPQVCVAFPGSVGTNDMKSKIKEMNRQGAAYGNGPLIKLHVVKE